MNVGRFLKSVRSEFKHIDWPSRTQTIAYTVAVIVLTIVIAYYLGLFDWLFSLGLELLLSR